MKAQLQVTGKLLFLQNLYAHHLTKTSRGL